MGYKRSNYAVNSSFANVDDFSKRINVTNLIKRNKIEEKKITKNIHAAKVSGPILLFVIFLISTILYGSLLRYHYKGGQKFLAIQKVAVFFAGIVMPRAFSRSIESITLSATS